MEELLKLQKEFIISDKEMYILSKLEQCKATDNLIEKTKSAKKQEEILKNYGLSLAVRQNFLKQLQFSTFHTNEEFIEKYEGAELDEKLQTEGKKGMNKLTVIIIVVVLFVVLANFYKDDDKPTNISNSQTEQVNLNGTYSYKDDSVNLNLTISGNVWSSKATIISGFGKEYDNDNSQYDSGVINGNDLYEKSGMVKIGYVSNKSVITSFSGSQVKLDKN